MSATSTVERPRRGSRRIRERRPVWEGRPSVAVRLLKAIVIAVIVIIMLYPFVSMIMRSFADVGASMKATLIPSKMTLAAYQSILSGGIVTRAMLVSAFITVVGTTIAVVLTTTLAYSLTRTKDVPGSKFVLYLVLFTMLFSAGIIPNYLLVKQLGLLDSYWSLILPTVISAFNMVVIRNFFMQIPGELIESARVDGASDLAIFTRIVLPLSKAPIAVITLFYAVSYWNSFFNALIYINSPEKYPIQIVLNRYVLMGSPLDQIQSPGGVVPPPVSIQMAVVVIATIPILLVYPFAQKYFAKGVLTGAIKG